MIMGAPAASDKHVQVKFIKRDVDSIPELPSYPFSVLAPSDVTQLRSILNKVTNDGGDSSKDLAYDFLLNGVLLRQNLEQSIKEQGLSEEVVLELTCILATEAPTPDRKILARDWVTGISSTDDAIFASCYDGSVLVYGHDGLLKTEQAVHSSPVKCVTVLKDDVIVSGSHDQHAIVWNYGDETKLSAKMICKGHERSVDSVAGHADGDKFATGSYDTTIKIWSTAPQGGSEDRQPSRKAKKVTKEIPTQTPLVTLSHSQAVTSLVWKGDLWSCALDNTIRCWDIELAGPKATMPGPGPFVSMDYSELSGMIVTGSADPLVRLWDPRSKDVLISTVFRSHKGWVSTVKWSPVSEYVFVSGSYDTQVLMWDTRSPKAPLFVLEGHNDKVLALCWDKPGKILSGGADSAINTFNC